MGLDLTGPADERPIETIRRLTALKRSLTYDGMGYYSGGPNGEGCDSDDIDDLNADLACATMEALSDIDGLVAALQSLLDGIECTSCTCIEAYTGRGLTDPDCHRCGLDVTSDELDAARAAITKATTTPTPKDER